MNARPARPQSVRWWPHTTDERIASFRLRCLRIVEHLAGQGMDAALYRPGDAAPSVLVLSKRYDAGSLEQALQLRRTAGTRVLLDLCDNHFYFEGDDPGLAARAPVSLSVISNDERKFRRLFAGWRLPGTYLPWHAHTFSRALRLHSLCVVPVGLNPFTRCKTNNRVATALLHGLNVVATRIPGYDEFGEQVVLDDWGFGLGAYLDDAQRRRRDIEAGRQRLAQHYSLAAIAARWRAVTSD